MPDEKELCRELAELKSKVQELSDKAAYRFSGIAVCPCEVVFNR